MVEQISASSSSRASSPALGFSKEFVQDGSRFRIFAFARLTRCLVRLGCLSAQFHELDISEFSFRGCAVFAAVD